MSMYGNMSINGSLYVNSINASAYSTYSATNTGYIHFNNAFKIQWQTVSFSDNSDTWRINFIFPILFTNNVLGGFVQTMNSVNTSPSSIREHEIYIVNTSQMTIQRDSTNTSYEHTIFMIAIGF